ncbi:MAG TPA: hypothetical protein VMT79_21340 [Candidatus Binatia bacterium]|nr:hypothetical protein [Candidatus Binatia bacterium]
MDDKRGQPALAGLQHPAFGVGEAGEIQVRELGEIALGLAEARLECACRGPQRRDGARPRLGNTAAGIAHERLARRRVRGHAPGREQRVGLAGAQPVPHDRLGQPLLLAARQARQGGGGGGRQAAVIEVRGHLGGEPPAEGQAPLHPAAPMGQQLGDLRRRELIVIREGADDPRLVHRAHGAPGGIGRQQSGLVDDPGAGGLFHDHGDVRAALAAPAGQALEAIEDLVGAVPDRRHPQGQRGQGGAGIRARAPEGRERGGQLRDGHVEDQAHGRVSARGKSW